MRPYRNVPLTVLLRAARDEQADRGMCMGCIGAETTLDRAYAAAEALVAHGQAVMQTVDAEVNAAVKAGAAIPTRVLDWGREEMTKTAAAGRGIVAQSVREGAQTLGVVASEIADRAAEAALALEQAAGQAVADWGKKAGEGFRDFWGIPPWALVGGLALASLALAGGAGFLLSGTGGQALLGGLGKGIGAAAGGALRMRAVPL